MTTRAEAESLIGKYIEATWTEPDGSVGGMAGWLEKIETETDGREIAVLDWGYGAYLPACTIREVDPPANDPGPFWLKEKAGET
jgi:hypothetical protein